MERKPTQGLKLIPFSNKHASYMCNECTINTLPIDDKQELSFTSNDLLDADPEEQSNNKLPSTISSDNFACFKQRGLHFIHLYARSVLNKIHELQVIVNKSRAAIIAIT